MSILEMVGGKKHINPHCDIKAENSSYYPDNKIFTEIEINEVLCYMEKQREQLTKAKELLRKFLDTKSIEETCVAESEAEHFLNSNNEKVYVVLRGIVSRDGWSIGSDRIEKVFDKREKAEEYINSEKKKPVPENYNIPVYTISEYDVIWRYIK